MAETAARPHLLALSPSSCSLHRGASFPAADYGLARDRGGLCEEEYPSRKRDFASDRLSLRAGMANRWERRSPLLISFEYISALGALSNRVKVTQPWKASMSRPSKHSCTALPAISGFRHLCGRSTWSPKRSSRWASRRVWSQAKPFAKPWGAWASTGNVPSIGSAAPIPNTSSKKGSQQADHLGQHTARLAIGFLDEVWWSRFALPRLYAWQDPDAPVRLIEQVWQKGDPDRKALACYGVLWQRGTPSAPKRDSISCVLLMDAR